LMSPQGRARSQGPLVGRVRVPGDKSITHRAIILAALASGSSSIRNPNLGTDVRATITMLRALGVSIRVSNHPPMVEVESLGRADLKESDTVLDAGNSGTSLRTMLGVCAGVEGLTILTGDRSVRRRPMLRVVTPLRLMGAKIDGRSAGELAPLAVRGGELTAIDYESPVASAQVKTAVLLAGLAARGRTSFVEPAASRDHTERMLEAGGVAVHREGLTVAVDGGEKVRPRDWRVPGDLSAAMFLLVAAALVPDSDLVVEQIGLNPSRTGGIDALAEMGADVAVERTQEWDGEPVGNVRVRASKLGGISISADRVVGLIDEIPALSIAAARAEGETVIRDASELRVKESDRIEAIVRGLQALGADARARPDGLVVRGPSTLGGGTVDSFGDHRIAMAFAVADLVGEGKVTIRDRTCIETSFPGFLEVLANLRAPG
jgi:3-phosphoshikimate 1-carboxyvinyltransferase